MSIIQQPPTDGPPGVTTTKEAAKEPGPPSTDMVVTELIQARIKERSTLLPSTNLVEDIIIARDYLRQHQDRSVGQLTESVLVSMIGKNETVPQEVIDSVAERLRFGRTTGPTNDFENLLKIYCYYIEHICKKLKLPLHSGVAAGVVWHPSHVPAQKIIMTTNASMIVIPEWTLMLCHFICKLLSRAVSKKGASETIAVSYDSEQVLTKICATPTLRKYAAGFFAYCATQNRMPLRSIKNATGLTRRFGCSF